MKKIIAFLSTMAIIAIISSCSDAKSEANCTYFVAGDSITYTDSLDAQYDSIIGLYFVASKYVAYTFTESSKSNEGSVSYAIDQCDGMAVVEFQQKSPKTLSLNTVKNELFAANQTYFANQGITSSDSISLHPFTVYLTLWNLTYNGVLLNSQIEVN
ncbi:MAG: hypothetical protein J5616_01365 [Bacteroidaceae bacterium]|nr:hypothetical protein [Bacteroidaceae bacterium]